MTPPSGPVMLPARLSAEELAAAIGRTPDEVRLALQAIGEDSGADQVLGARTAIDIAARLGVTATVEARDLALETLYEYETRGEIESEPGGRAGAMVAGVLSDLDELDELIESVSEHWSVARMPLIDRNILRLGLYELRSEQTTPTAVIVAEAVRLAQTYSTERSPSFVNGILATLARSIR